jgi:hypothetical protein
MKNHSSDLHYSTNVETHGVRLNVETHGVRLKSFWIMRNVLPGLLRGMGRKRETKHEWNSPLTHSASKKELTENTRILKKRLIFAFIFKLSKVLKVSKTSKNL